MEESGLVIYKIVLLAMVVAAYFGMRRNPKTEWKYLAIWLALFAGIILGALWIDGAPKDMMP